MRNGPFSRIDPLTEQRIRAEERSKVIAWLVRLAEDFASDGAAGELITESDAEQQIEHAVLRGGAAALATAATELEARGHLL